jgi:hypothetical protein
LHPPLRRIFIHAHHSRFVTVTRFGAFRQALMGRRSTWMSPSATASRIALRTVEAQTPARAARWPMLRVQAPRFPTSTLTTAITAASARVNRA